MRDPHCAFGAKPIAPDQQVDTPGPPNSTMASHTHRRWLATALAHAMLTDAEKPEARTAQALAARACACLGTQDAPPPWLPSLAQTVATRWARLGMVDTVPSLAKLVMTLPPWINERLPELDDTDEHALHEPPDGLRHEPNDLDQFQVRKWLLRPAQMTAVQPSLSPLNLPELPTTRDCALWLGATPERLHWLTHPSQRWREHDETLCRRVDNHYQYRLLPKRLKGLRLIEAPKAELKMAQRRLLDGLLALIPVHEAAHGFVRGRGIHTHAHGHAEQACVIAFDLRDFFPSIGEARVRALWRTLGYPEDVSQSLTMLCTTRTPLPVRERLGEANGLSFEATRRLRKVHLPQGAPTSPALANLCAFDLDLRLDGLAHRFGAHYSRYADDLVFSGPASLAKQFRSLKAWVEAIANDEGFELHPGKQRLMRSHQRQRITGLVINKQTNIPREDYDLLRAELHRASKLHQNDPQLLNHLQGRVAWASQSLAPARVRKLQALLSSIPR